MTRTSLVALATVTPPFEAAQDEVARFQLRVLDSLEDRERSERVQALASRVFSRAGIERRHVVLPDYLRERPEDFEFFPPNWSLEPFPGTASRLAVFESQSVELADRAARAAIESSGLAASDITHIVLTTCTGLFAPGPETHLVSRLGLRPDVSRTVIGFMGCYAGLTALRTVDSIVRADPESVVLLISVELCCLHFQKRAEPDLIVANALFGDGCAAAVFTSESRGRELTSRPATIAATHSCVGPNSLGEMAWRVGDTGFEMRLAASVPGEIRRECPAFVDELLARAGCARERVGSWAIHPGGVRIVEAAGSSLGLGDDALDATLETLRCNGNMSSAAIFFVLQEQLARGADGPLVALGFGPGLTVEGTVLTLPN